MFFVLMLAYNKYNEKYGAATNFAMINWSAHYFQD